MLNFFYFKEFHGQMLLTNEFGNYAFVGRKQLGDLVHDQIDYGTPLGQELLQKRFLSDGSVHGFTDAAQYAYQASKNYVLSATSLFIFVVTTGCNLGCVYCQANDGPETVRMYMSQETAEKAVDIALSSPNHYLTFEFQGGEPLMNFDVVKHIILYTEANNRYKEVSFSIVSNLTLITDEMIDFLKAHKVSISTSLDGDAMLHNQNRPDLHGGGTYNRVLASIRKVRAAGLYVGAIQTTTRASLTKAKEIIDTYVQLGLTTVFLRPLTPLGCAKRYWEEIGYTPEEFIHFYRKALSYILQKNREGVAIQEGHASIFLRKILHGIPQNYMELRSPCGAALGQMAFYCDGNVYTCDEGRMLAEMGMPDFCLGSVYRNTYQEIISGSICRTACTASVTEALPSCCDCVYQPYCGVCPVVNYALYGDIIAGQPHHYRCKIYEGILDTLFSMIQSNSDELAFLKEWHT